MKQLLYVTMLILVIASCKSDGQNGLNSESKLADTLHVDSLNAGIKKYDIQSGTLKYIIYNGKDKKNPYDTSESYFADYGAKEARWSNKHKSLMIEKLGFVWSINMEDMRGNKLLNTLNMGFNPDMIDFKNISDAVQKQFQITKVGEDKVLGKECTVYSMQANEMGLKTRIWLHKFVKLKVELTSPMGPSNVIECISFDEGATPSPDKFEVPEGVQITMISK
jgi:hypothetical protein